VPRFVDKTKKAQEIGSAAIKVFRKIGYHRARMADIALAAGVGKGTLYEYFKNKADILRFEFEHYFSTFKAGATKSMAEASTSGSRLLALIDFAFDHIATWEDHCAVYVDYFGAVRASEEEYFSLSRIYAEVQDLIKLLFEEGQAGGEITADIDPVAAAELLVSVFDGVVLRGVFAERRCEEEALRVAVQRLVTTGLFLALPPGFSKKGNA